MGATAPQIDLLSGDFYGEQARAAYAWMRQHSPVHYDERNQLWGVATYDGIVEVARDPATFSNAGGSRPDTGPLPWMIDLDGAEHLQRRRLVSAGFTPRRVALLEAHISQLCDDLIDDVCEQGECDVVRDLAAPLPLIVIGDLLGVPPEDRDQLLHWSDAMLASLSGDPAHLQAAADAFFSYNDYARRTIEARRAAPTDDLVSVLAHAQVDGAGLDDAALVMESLLILVGGDETTRHVISGGTEQLLLHPGQMAMLRADPTLLPSAVEEMLRWVSPIKNMNRTLTCDTELGGQQLRAGDKALLLYESANFDEAHFAAPDRFDVMRTPNDHVAFGKGAHFCLGASLARLEVRVMLERMLARLPDLELAAATPLPRFIGALRQLPVRFSPAARSRPT